MCEVQQEAYGGSLERVKRIYKGQSDSNAGRGVLSTLLGVFASLVVLSEVGIAGLLHDHRLYDGRWRSESGFAGVYAGSSLA